MSNFDDRTHRDPDVLRVACAYVRWEWDDELQCAVDRSIPSCPIYLNPSVYRDDALLMAMQSGMDVQFRKSGYGEPDSDGYVLCRIDSADVTCIEPCNSAAIDSRWQQEQAFCAAVVWCACQAELKR